MTKVKTSKLTGIALDWAVAKAEGMDIDGPTVITREFYWDDDGLQWVVEWEPTTNWAQGGALIEREDINVNRYTYSEVTESGQEIYRKDGWTAFTTVSAYWMTPKRAYGPTPLIAAMRCYVMIHFGDEIEIPQELFE